MQDFIGLLGGAVVDEGDRVIDAGRVRALRAAKGWSQTRLGDEAGVDQGTVSKIEKGQTRSPEYETVARLARALGTSVEYLRGGAAVGNIRLGDPDLVILFNEVQTELDERETDDVKTYVRYRIERARQRRTDGDE